MSLYELAELFSEAAGRAITYVEETVEQAYESRASYGAPPWQLEAWVTTYLQIASGELDTVTTDIETLLGRPPTSLDEYLAAHPEVLARRG